VIGAYRASLAANVAYIVAGADELRLTHREQGAEFGIRAVIDPQSVSMAISLPSLLAPILHLTFPGERLPV
jgi:hypothetical protein